MYQQILLIFKYDTGIVVWARTGTTILLLARNSNAFWYEDGTAATQHNWLTLALKRVTSFP